MTTSQALATASEQLVIAGIESASLDARLLLEWVLKARREDLVREPDRVLTQRERLIYEKALSLRALRRPLPYLTGEAWFYGRPFKVNRAVLIPRPETEMLVEEALKATVGLPEPLIADIGTGSGCIAITLALENPRCRIWATDLSPDALRIARKNIARHAVADQVILSQGDLMAPLPQDLRLDAILSNLPYIREPELMDLQPEVRDYEPSLALTGQSGATGIDGTTLHRRLLESAPLLLQPAGKLLLEVGQGQAPAVAAHAHATGYDRIEVIKDYSGIERIVIARKPA